MGARGPAPKPTALKRLEGNPGKQKINKAEPMPNAPEDKLKPPSHLLPEAVKEWKRLAKPLVALGLLTEVDTTAFAELCQNYAYYMQADKAVRGLENGGVALIETQSGYLQQHPWLSVRRQYYETWRRGLADFGLTPASRSRLMVGDSSDKPGQASDDMEKLLSGDW